MLDSVHAVRRGKYLPECVELLLMRFGHFPSMEELVAFMEHEKGFGNYVATGIDNAVRAAKSNYELVLEAYAHIQAGNLHLVD